MRGFPRFVRFASSPQILVFPGYGSGHNSCPSRDFRRPKKERMKVSPADNRCARVCVMTASMADPRRNPDARKGGLPDWLTRLPHSTDHPDRALSSSGNGGVKGPLPAVHSTHDQRDGVQRNKRAEMVIQRFNPLDNQLRPLRPAAEHPNELRSPPGSSGSRCTGGGKGMHAGASMARR